MNEQYEKNIKNELNEYIKSIIEIENEDNIFTLRIDNILNRLSKQMSELEVNHLNILLLGPSGVGKSTLINSILKLNEEKEAKVKITKPETKTFNIYESETISNIRLIDSRGIEKGDYNIDEFVNEVTNYIEKSELDGNPDKFIHCIWYCITGTRFEDIEEKTLLKLASIYEYSKLPIIIVYTQGIIPNYYNAINEEINNINNNLTFIPVIAKDIQLSGNKVMKSQNLDNLLLISLDKAKNAVYSSVFSSLRKLVKHEIEIEIEKSLTELENIPKYENEEEKFIDIFKMLLFEPESKKDLKENTKIIINEINIMLKEKRKEIIGQCLNSFVESKINELTNKLIDLQAEVNSENNGNLKEYKSSGQFKEEIIHTLIDSLSNKIGDYGNNIFELKMIKLLATTIKNDMNTLIDSDSTKNSLNSKIKNQFQRIISIVEGFHF